MMAAAFEAATLTRKEEEAVAERHRLLREEEVAHESRNRMMHSRLRNAERTERTAHKRSLDLLRLRRTEVESLRAEVEDLWALSCSACREVKGKGDLARLMQEKTLAEEVHAKSVATKASLLTSELAAVRPHLDINCNLQARLDVLRAEHHLESIELRESEMSHQENHARLRSQLLADCESLATRHVNYRSFVQRLDHGIWAQQRACEDLLEIGDEEVCSLATLRDENSRLAAEEARTSSQFHEESEQYWQLMPFQLLSQDGAACVGEGAQQELERLQLRVAQDGLEIARLEDDLYMAKSLADSAAVEVEETLGLRGQLTHALLELGRNLSEAPGANAQRNTRHCKTQKKAQAQSVGKQQRHHGAPRLPSPPPPSLVFSKDSPLNAGRSNSKRHQLREAALPPPPFELALDERVCDDNQPPRVARSCCSIAATGPSSTDMGKAGYGVLAEPAVEVLHQLVLPKTAESKTAEPKSQNKSCVSHEFPSPTVDKDAVQQHELRQVVSQNLGLRAEIAAIREKLEQRVVRRQIAELQQRLPQGAVHRLPSEPVVAALSRGQFHRNAGYGSNGRKDTSGSPCPCAHLRQPQQQEQKQRQRWEQQEQRDEQRWHV